MDSHALFVEAVRAAADLPMVLREHAPEVMSLEEHCFDESYIAFLDTQIHLGTRGPEWTQPLTRRRAALRLFCGVTLLRGTVQVGDAAFTVEIHPESRHVVHWEEYEHAT